MSSRKQDIDRNVRLASWVELSQLRALHVIPEAFEKARIDLDGATPIYDLNGELLFRRAPIGGARERIGYADLAAHPALGEPLLAVSMNTLWNEAALLKEGVRAATALGLRNASGAKIRFVAYSFPKIALQFMRGQHEELMLELYTWEPVPPSTRTMFYEPPSNFERWSFLDELPRQEFERRVARYDARISTWREGFRQISDFTTVDSAALLAASRIVWPLVNTRELHYSARNTDHHVCYELRAQQTNVWCVAASVEMLLDFYRYEYTQVRLAAELGLGTLANPVGLPYANDGDVVTVIEKMSSNALTAAMDTSPNFAEFVSEIDANRPLVSFIPGHSRTVAGYTESYITIFRQPPFRGLLVFDPWPPNTGVITRWENFDSSTYRRTFTAHVTKV